MVVTPFHWVKIPYSNIRSNGMLDGAHGELGIFVGTVTPTGSICGVKCQQIHCPPRIFFLLLAEDDGTQLGLSKRGSVGMNME